jgi:hypothetical protein
MTDQRLDPEQTIRDWLSDSAPERAPASLRETLVDVTSGPPGRARQWPSPGYSLRFVGRVATALAILAIAGSGVFLYSNLRTAEPAASATSTPGATPTGTAGATGTPGITPLQPNVVHIRGSNWNLVRGAFPQMVAPAWSRFQPTVFEVVEGSSSGFVAFVPSAGGLARHRTGVPILAAFKTAGPTSPTSWETRVYTSSDGINWSEWAVLPSDAATVTSVASSGGNIVAVGWTGEVPGETAMAWTTTDFQTWQATTLPAPAQTQAHGVAAGPAGFLAWGYATTGTEFWISSDGTTWRSVATSGLPADGPIDALYGVSDGWVIRGPLSDRAAVWHSADGATWTQAWTGPGMSGMEGYALGAVFKAPGGRFLSFGGVAMAPGGNTAVPFDMLIWTSSDELSWTITDRVKSPGWISGFASGPGGYVAAGVVAPGDPGVLPLGTLAIWTSQDGRTWEPYAGIPQIPSIEVLSVAGNGARVIVTFIDRQGIVQLLVRGGIVV